MSIWSRTNSERERERFWRTPPPDPTRAHRRAGVPYYAKRSRDRFLMPDDFMPIGEHASKHLRAVPPDYLHWVNTQPWSKTWPQWHPIADYLTRFPSENRPPTPTRTRPRSQTTATPQTTAPLPSQVGSSGFSPSGSASGSGNPASSIEHLATTPPLYLSHTGHLHTLPGWEDYLHAFAVGALHLSRDYYQPGKLPHYALTPYQHRRALHHPCLHLIPDHALHTHQSQWLQYFQSKPKP